MALFQTFQTFLRVFVSLRLIPPCSAVPYGMAGWAVDRIGLEGGKFTLLWLFIHDRGMTTFLSFTFPFFFLCHCCCFLSLCHWPSLPLSLSVPICSPSSWGLLRQQCLTLKIHLFAPLSSFWHSLDMSSFPPHIFLSVSIATFISISAAEDQQWGHRKINPDTTFAAAEKAEAAVRRY